MTGVETTSGPIHFLLLGTSKEHILRTIEYFDAQQVVFFTSQNLMNENQPFIDEIGQKGVSVLETVFLDPFEEAALEHMIQRMKEAYDFHSRGETNQIIAGLTGGTNLMVVAMGMVCLAFGLQAHYVVNNETNDVIDISFFQNLPRNTSISEIQLNIPGGKPDE